MLRKKQVITIVSIAVISFLIGTTLNTMTMATDDDRGNPFEKIWEEIDDLQSRVDSMNIVMTVTGDPTWTELIRGEWTDLLLISDAEVSEGSDAIAISGCLFQKYGGSNVTCQTQISSK